MGCTLPYLSDIANILAEPSKTSTSNHNEMDVAFLLTIGSFLLTVELFYLQLTILAFLLTVGAFLLAILAFLRLQVELFAYSGKVRPIRALRDCKRRSLTVRKKKLQL